MRNKQASGLKTLQQRGWALGVGLALMGLPSLSGQANESKAAGRVSYYREVRPILQANCQGCHQPAKSKGGFVMTEFKGLLSGGDSEGTAVVAGQPEKSALFKMVTPHEGEVRMPKGRNPLLDSEVALIGAWIQQGAVDDTPPDAKRHYDLEHPPLYSRPPVISSLDFSPDGKLLAVAGFHEVLLYDQDGAELAGRLIGLSERIQSLRFSPDGQWLAVAGGDPARLGEIQVWDVAKRKLAYSVPISYDTLYGRELVTGQQAHRVRLPGQHGARDRSGVGEAGGADGIAQRLGDVHHILGQGRPYHLRRPGHEREADRNLLPALC